MTTEFRLPELGEDIESGDVISVLVSVGDKVEEEQPLMEIETDKATIEVPAPVSGVIKEIHVKEGSKVKIGELLVTLDELDGAQKGGREEIGAEDGKKGEKESKAEAKEEKKEEKKDKKKQAKEKEEEGEKARADGEEEREEKAGAEQGQKEKEEKAEDKRQVKAVEEGKDGGTDSREKQGEVLEFGRKSKATAKDEARQEPAPAAPSVRRLARELGVDIDQVPGSGPGGRISEDDVKNYTRWIVTRGIGEGADAIPAVAPVTPAPLPDFAQWGEVERKPMSNVRRKTAEAMTSAWLTIPHVTQNDMADITNLEELRKEFGKRVEKAGGKLTITAILLKIIASALKRFPQCNASVDMSSQEIIYKKYYNIGVAVDTERGLYVPVIKDVDKKDILDISIELMDLAEKARNRKLSPEDMKGGTFTISNQGTIGGIYFSPIINWPETAILGVSRSRVEAVYVDGKFEPRLMMPLSLSHDHRAIDGADAVRFLRWVVEALEQPFKMVLEG